METVVATGMWDRGPPILTLGVTRMPWEGGLFLSAQECASGHDKNAGIQSHSSEIKCLCARARFSYAAGLASSPAEKAVNQRQHKGALERHG